MSNLSDESLVNRIFKQDAEITRLKAEIARKDAIIERVVELARSKPFLYPYLSTQFIKNEIEHVLRSEVEE